MQCQQCQFENMPGLNRCMRCGSVLGVSSTPIPIFPPRMPGWKKPIRGFFRFFRFNGIQTSRLPSMPRWAAKISSSSLFSAVFSVIPGLAQLLSHQFRTIFWYWIAWLVLIGVTVFCWGGAVTAFSFGLALTIHVWIAMRGGILRDFEVFRDRIIIFLVLVFAYFILYYNGSRLGLRALGIQGGYSLVNAPYSKIHTGDYLVGRMGVLSFQRGEFVFTRLRAVGGHGQGLASDGFVRIVGLPGETVEVRQNSFFINGKALDAVQYSVPAGFSKVKDFTVSLSVDQYFIIAEFHGTGYNLGHIRSLCVLTSRDFEAKAFLRWWPLMSRGFIENNQ
jgi:hypothetical protein